MLIVLLLIIGVVGALRATPAIAQPRLVRVAPVIHDDATDRDLQARLQRIVLTSLSGYEDQPAEPLVEVVAPRPAAKYPMGRDIPAMVPDLAATSAPPTRIADVLPTGGKRALPPSSALSLDPASTRQSTPFPASDLGSLAARFASTNQPMEIAPPSSAVGSRMPEAPGVVAPGADSALAARGFNGVDSGQQASSNPPSTRLGLPGTVGGSGFTFVSSPTAGTNAASEPSSTVQSRAIPQQPAPPRRSELPGSVSPAQGSQPIDIRAILRGEAIPIGALPSPSGFGIEAPGSPIKPHFATGPLPPLIVQGVPLGAAVFDPGALQLRQPVSLRALPPSQQPAARSGLPASVTNGHEARQPLGGDLSDLDATRIMDDFDLPATGFETHVFSTAELVDAESEIFARVATRIIEPPNPVDDRKADRVPALPSSSLLSPAMQEQARHYLNEVAALTDVVFVKLLSSDGMLLLSAGGETSDVGIDKAITTLTSIARMEVQQLDLDNYDVLSLEATGAALLVSPVHDGALLAVLLSNPAQLGLLRRQLRKPITSIRTIFLESRVS